MAIIVQKFGGTSIATTDRIKKVALIIQEAIQQGKKPIIVVSAMAGITNQLVSLCLELSDLKKQNDNLSEYDAALASGETVTAALLSLHLQTMGINARSFHGWQLPINTSAAHSHALIDNINPKPLLAALADDIVPIIAGFQGITANKRITTLGRGGSDTSATAIAAAINAETCEIYTDIDGVYTADPRLVDNAQLLPKLSYSEMLEFASSGAKVLNPRAIQIAMRYNIPLHVISSFSQKTGTIIQNQEVEMERPHITGIAYNNDYALCRLNCVEQNRALKIIAELNARNIKLHNIHFPSDNEIMLSFTTNLLNIAAVEQIAHPHGMHLEYRHSNITQISIVGIGLTNDTLTMQHLLNILSQHDITPFSIQTSETHITCLIPTINYEVIIKELHTALIKEKA